MRSSRHWICCETAATDRAEPPSQLYAADGDAVDCAFEQHSKTSCHNASQTYRSRLQIQQDCHILMADAIVQLYGGCAGYFNFNGNLNTCFTIRTAAHERQSLLASRQQQANGSVPKA